MSTHDLLEEKHNTDTNKRVSQDIETSNTSKM